MLFPTFDFLLFAIPTLIGFWVLAGRPVARVGFLLVASYFFYMAGPKTEPPPAPWYFAGLLLFSTVLDFACAKEIHRLALLIPDDDPYLADRLRRRKTAWLTASLVGNLGLLGYFKYANFFLSAFADLAGAFGVSLTPYHLDVVLPLGISFYTFQSLSYTLDVYRGRITPEPSFRRFALFVVFFPQLVAGPIVRASQFLPQLHAGPRFSREDLEIGAFRICKGLVKKVVLGDWIAVNLTDRIFDNPSTFTSAELLLALYAYTLQIYADFSGYSDIAIGLGRMLGFRLPENFDRPYQSRDIAEYWRRWHMTLSTWLRDYLFFSLLARWGARAGYLVVWFTMFLVGMWHGASWNFVIYANMHALAMVFNRWQRAQRSPSADPRSRARQVGVAVLVGTAIGLLGAGVLRLSPTASLALGIVVVAVFLLILWMPSPSSKASTVVHIALTFHLLVLSRIFFRAPDLDTARAFAAGLLRFDLHGLRPGLASPGVWAVLVLGLAYHFTPKRWVDETATNVFRRVPGLVLGLLFLLMAFGLMKLLEGSPRAFIYFQF